MFYIVKLDGKKVAYLRTVEQCESFIARTGIVGATISDGPVWCIGRHNEYVAF